SSPSSAGRHFSSILPTRIHPIRPKCRNGRPFNHTSANVRFCRCIFVPLEDQKIPLRPGLIYFEPPLRSAQVPYPNADRHPIEALCSPSITASQPHASLPSRF